MPHLLSHKTSSTSSKKSSNRKKISYNRSSQKKENEKLAKKARVKKHKKFFLELTMKNEQNKSNVNLTTLRIKLVQKETSMLPKIM